MSTLRKINDAVEFLKDSGIKQVTLGFSTGKDSVMAWYILKKAGVKVIPFYFYIVPKLGFVERNIKMYEDYFGTEVVRLPHPILFDYINHQDFQTLDRTKDMLEYDLPNESFESLVEWYLESVGITEKLYDVAGIKMADSLNRRLLIRKKGFRNDEKKVLYIVKDFTNTEIMEFLKQYKIPLIRDYELFGRSWDGLSYHYSYGVRRHYPEDWAKINQYFPLIKLEILRYEQFRKIKNL